MNGKCFDIGVIQTFVDGELDSGRVEDLVRHLSVCEECTLLAADLESENEAAFALLDNEFNVLVPTERLRTKVFASIDAIESRESVGIWTKLTAGFGLTGLMARPGMTAFASILLFIAFAAVGMRYLSPSNAGPGSNVARNDRPDRVSPNVTDAVPQVQAPRDSAALPVSDSPQDEIATPLKRRSNDPVLGARGMNAVHREPKSRSPRPVRIAKSLNTATVPGLNPPPSPELAAEDGYLRTIAMLNRTVNEDKDYVLRPSERVTFERDLAVVNDAIKKMKGEVRQNPSNTAAREVLRSSYKNKIDLLNSVAERSETVTSLD